MIEAMIKKLFIGTPLEKPVRALTGRKSGVAFKSSDQYWDARYSHGGNSGAGSYGRLADFKAEVLNTFVERHGIQSVIEFGSGDGNQLSLAFYPAYMGIDVSETAVQACRKRFDRDSTRTFLNLKEYKGETSELALSLDVIYHLVEDAVFEEYMTQLFRSAKRFVIIYASNEDLQAPEKHVRHRRFTDWVDANRQDFRLVEHIPNQYPFDPNSPDDTSFADFFVFEARP